MPCRDYDYAPSHGYSEDYRKRCDELAAQLCASRQVLLELYDYATKRLVKELPSNLAEDIASEIEGLKNHRENDKTHAILELGHKISRLQADVKKIKELGGKPASTLLRKIKDLKSIKSQMKESNSLHSDLY